MGAFCHDRPDWESYARLVGWKSAAHSDEGCRRRRNTLRSSALPARYAANFDDLGAGTHEKPGRAQDAMLGSRIRHGDDAMPIVPPAREPGLRRLDTGQAPQIEMKRLLIQRLGFRRREFDDTERPCRGGPPPRSGACIRKHDRPRLAPKAVGDMGRRAGTRPRGSRMTEGEVAVDERPGRNHPAGDRTPNEAFSVAARSAWASGDSPSSRMIWPIGAGTFGPTWM
jgi:hypothetical protein